MTAEEKVQYVDDFFKRRIHDTGFDGLLEVSTRISKPTDNELFIEITFILKRHYCYTYMLSDPLFDAAVITKGEYLNYVYDKAKESLFKEQRRDMLDT